ncbi:MAG: phosphomannomutase, partial [Mesorhizobium sp.]
ILAVLGTMASTKKKLSQLRELWKLPVCASDRLQDFSAESSSRLMDRLANLDALHQFLAPFGTVAEVDKTDGFRVRMRTGEIIHLRPSGNAPELRCYSEASSESRATTIVASVLKRAQAFASQTLEGI